MSEQPLAALPQHRILRLVVPPIELINWLERVWEGKRAKGEEVPENFTRWLERWKAIRSAEASDVDYIDPEVWQAVGERVQPTLLDVPTKVEYR